MSKSVPSHANPAMLKWAREKAGLTLEAVACSEKLDSTTLEAWESGESMPTLAMLRKLADRYKRPLHVFYLPSPQQSFNIIKDFRLLAGSQRPEFSPELRLAIRRCQERQQWAAEQIQESDGKPVDFLDSATVKSSIPLLARRIRKLIAVSIEKQVSAKDGRKCFWLWRRAIEDVGVFVWQVSGISVDEMRGFALADSFAPVIVLNSADSVAARLFSLIHELGHLLVGESGVSSSNPETLDPNSQLEIERFCNRLAAETLIPKSDFDEHLPPQWRSNDDDALRALAARYGVSPAVIAIRLVELRLAEPEYAKKKLKQLQNRTAKSTGRVTQSVKAVSNNGEAFARLAVSAYEGGEIHGGQLTHLLGMKLKHLPAVTRRLYPYRGLVMTQEQ